MGIYTVHQEVTHLGPCRSHRPRAAETNLNGDKIIWSLWLPNVFDLNESNSDGETNNFTKFQSPKINHYILLRLPIQCKCKLIGKSAATGLDWPLNQSS